MFIVPSFQNISSKYIFTANLNNEIFRLQFHWNSREEIWYMSILDSNEILILSGVKLVPNYDIIDRYRYLPGMPKGRFVLSRLPGNPDTRVTFENFGVSFILIFFTDEEVENGVQ